MFLNSIARIEFNLIYTFLVSTQSIDYFLFITDSGRKKLTEILKLCSPLKTKDNVTQLEYWLSETWVNLAMGKLLHGLGRHVIIKKS